MNNESYIETSIKIVNDDTVYDYYNLYIVERISIP